MNTPLKHQYPIHQIFSVPGNAKGEIGIELETIGKRLPLDHFHETNLWKIVPDQSVKPRPGEEAREYVLRQPIGRAKVEQALTELLNEFKLHNSEVAEGRLSNSTHIHINAQQLTMVQVYTWLTLYFIFEELLVRWAGEDRIGNLFCLRAKDAEGLIHLLKTCAKQDEFQSFKLNSYRYAAANVVALTKYGSLEFRALRGTANKDVLLLWINTLLAIKDKALEYRDPVAVLADFSQRSCLGMIRHVLPLDMQNFVLTQRDVIDVMYEGARLAQDFVFATKWKTDKVEPQDIKPKVGKPAGTLDMYIQEAVHAPQGGTWATVSLSPNVWDDAPLPPPHPAPPSHGSYRGLATPSGFKKVPLAHNPAHIIRVHTNVLDGIRADGCTLRWKSWGTDILYLSVCRYPSGEKLRKLERNEYDVV